MKKPIIVGGKKRPILTTTNTPILQLMHDAVGPVNRVKSLTKILKEDLSLSHPNHQKTLDMINQSADDLNAAIDKFYNNTNNK